MYATYLQEFESPTKNVAYKIPWCDIVVFDPSRDCLFVFTPKWRKTHG